MKENEDLKKEIKEIIDDATDKMLSIMYVVNKAIILTMKTSYDFPIDECRKVVWSVSVLKNSCAELLASLYRGDNNES